MSSIEISPSSVENKSFCEVPKYVINTRPHCPKLMKFTFSWMNYRIDEINVYKNHNIFELKALKGGMNVTETTNYIYDAEFSIKIVHGCRIMIKIVL